MNIIDMAKLIKEEEIQNMKDAGVYDIYVGDLE